MVLVTLAHIHLHTDDVSVACETWRQDDELKFLKDDVSVVSGIEYLPIRWW